MSRGRVTGWRLALAPWEIVLLLAVGVWAFAPVVALLIATAGDSRTLTGADGPIAGDQLQYMAWIRDAAAHGLAANLFQLEPNDHVFAHPMFTLSGFAAALGAPVTLTYLAWKPVGAIVLAGGALAWARRLLPSQPAAQAAAAVLAVFSFSPLAAVWLLGEMGSVTSTGHVRVAAGEFFAAAQLWGSPQSAAANGLTPVTILLVERARRDGPRARAFLVAATVSAALVSWLHPWQGVVVGLVLVGLAAWPGQPLRRRAVALVAAGGAFALLAYYGLLSRHAEAWELASRQNDVGVPPLWTLLLVALPLLVPAALGVRRPGGSDSERALVLWIPAGVVSIYLVDAFPTHFLAGLTFPLAILALRGVARWRVPAAVAVAAVLVATLPGMLHYAREFRRIYRSPAQQLYLVSADADALDYLDDDAPAGGVLASPGLAAAVPSRTGRPVWAGHPSWTPDYGARTALTGRLFAGQMAAQEARDFVLGSRARLVVGGCGSRDLRPALGPLLSATRRFGCATVYVMRRAGWVDETPPPSPRSG